MVAPNYRYVIQDGGQWERKQLLIPLIGLPVMIQYCDCWVELGESDDTAVLAVHTELGSHTRWHSIIKALRSHPAYLRDAVLEQEPTLMTFYFSVSEDMANTLLGMTRKPIDLQHHWDAVTADESGETTGREQQ